MGGAPSPPNPPRGLKPPSRIRHPPFSLLKPPSRSLPSQDPFKPLLKLNLRILECRISSINSIPPSKIQMDHVWSRSRRENRSLPPEDAVLEPAARRSRTNQAADHARKPRLRLVGRCGWPRASSSMSARSESASCSSFSLFTGGWSAVSFHVVCSFSMFGICTCFA